MITDAIETLFPTGQSAIIIELDESEFKVIQKNFRDIDRNHKRFKIDISNVEVIFIQKGISFENEESVKEEVIIKKPKPKFIDVIKTIFSKNK